MSMSITETPSGTCSGAAAKETMLRTPARTRVSVAACAAAGGVARMAIWMPRSRTVDSMMSVGKQRQPSMRPPTLAGSSSKAATMASLGRRPEKWAMIERPSLPTPTSATSWRRGPSRKPPMLSMHLSTS